MKFEKIIKLLATIFGIMTGICGLIVIIEQFLSESKNLHTISLPTSIFFGLIFVLIAVFLAVLIVVSKRNNKPHSPDPRDNDKKSENPSKYILTTSDPFAVNTQIPMKKDRSQPKEIKVCKLLPKGPESKPLRPLELSPDIYTKGLERLFEQITGGGPRVDYNLFIGVGHVGLSMASLLAGMLGHGENTPIGFVYPDISHDPILKEIPQLSGSPTILITDGEIKTGNSMKKLKAELINKYFKPIIHVAVLCASEVEGTIERMEDLREERYRTPRLTNRFKEQSTACQHELKEMPLPTWLAFFYDGTIKLTIDKRKIN